MYNIIKIWKQIACADTTISPLKLENNQIFYKKITIWTNLDKDVAIGAPSNPNQLIIAKFNPMLIITPIILHVYLPYIVILLLKGII